MSEFKFKIHTPEDIQQWPEPDWLIDSILPLGGFSQLFGEWRSGKTFVALDWALSVATGLPWGGKHQVAQGPVLYIFGEGRPGIKQRINAWIDYYGMAHRRADIPMYAIDVPLQLAEEDMGDINQFVEDMDQQLTEQPNPRLIIFDTLTRCMLGADEDKAKDMGRVVAAADYLRRGYDSAILLVHHSGYRVSRGRGSSALPGGLDTIIKATKKPESRIVTLSCQKMKDGTEFEDIAVTLSDSKEKNEEGEAATLVSVLGGRVPVENPVDALSRNKNGKKLLRYMVEECQLGRSYSDLRSVGVVSDGSFHRTLERLQELGFVENSGPVYFPSDQAVTAFDLKEFN